jgi:hypothetical protein
MKPTGKAASTLKHYQNQRMRGVKTCPRLVWKQDQLSSNMNSYVQKSSKFISAQQTLVLSFWQANFHLG